MNMVRFFLFVFVISFGKIYADPNLYAQAESRELIKLFNDKFHQLDSIILNIPKKEISIDREFLPVSDNLDLIDKSDSILKEKLETDINYLKSKIGLEISGQAYYRLDEGFGLDEEDATSRYKGKFQAEFAWAFFQSSLYKKSGKIKELQIQNDIEQIKQDKEKLGMLIFRQKEMFRLKYDSLTAGILLHRIENLSLLSLAQEYLLRTENISSDGLLDILNEKAEAERQLSMISESYPPAVDLSNPSGVKIIVDTTSLFTQIRQTHATLSTFQLERELLEQQYKNTDYLQSLTLTPFVRYSYYSRPTLPNSSNIDVGVRFRIPLSNETKRKKQNLKAQQYVLDNKKEQLLERIIEEVRFNIEEIERLNRSSEGELQRMKELKNYLNLRSQAYQNKIGEYSLLSRMKEYNIYLSCWEKLLSYQYKRDCLISDLQAFLTEVPITNFCVETDL